MKYFLIIVFFLPLIGYAQVDRESLFNSERTMDRRFTLYKGQIRVAGGYEFIAFKSEYDGSGNKALLSKNGISANQHSVNVNLRYGIIDYLDAELGFKLMKRNYRGEPIYIIGAPNPPLKLYTDVVTSGLSDMYLGLNARAPIPTNKLDIGGSFGLYLPTANAEPEQPQHKYTSNPAGDVINYFYLENWGYGVMSVFYRGFFKYRLENMAFGVNYQSRVPRDVSQNITWYSMLADNNTFVYTSEPYQYQQPQSSQLDILLEYQVFQWVNVYLGYESYRSKNGWTEESGNKIAIPNAKLSVINPGFEVLISNRLWLRQGV